MMTIEEITKQNQILCEGANEKNCTQENNRLYNNLRKIDHFRNLKSNWNNNGASEFPEILLNSVRDLILNLDHQPEIFPVADNSIQLEYDHGDDYLEIQIYESSVSVFEEKNGSEIEFQSAIDAKSVNKIVDSFYGYKLS